MKSNLAACVIAIVALSGCAFPGSKDRIELMNPQPIHTSGDSNSAAGKAEQIPVDNYYKALALAQTTYTETGSNKKDASAIADYVEEGIGLVDAYCLRWFRRLEDVQRQVNLQDKDWNIVRQLGTALLGVGKANSNWVTAYGAGNTAYEGVLQNFNESILSGPTSKKIKGRVFALLEQSASTLRAEAASLPFSQAYSRLERHADICTFGTIRDLLDTSLAQTESTIDTETGEIRSAPRELEPLSDADLGDRRDATRKILAVLKERDLQKTRDTLKLLGLAQRPQGNIDEATASLRQGWRDALRRNPGLASKVKAAP